MSCKSEEKKRKEQSKYSVRRNEISTCKINSLGVEKHEILELTFV